MTLAADMAVDFAGVAAQWEHEISRQTKSVSTDNAGKETVTLSAATTFAGVWQPLDQLKAAEYEQFAQGKTGRPQWAVMAPTSQSINIGDVLSFRGDTGEVFAAEPHEGHKEIILWSKT